MTDPSPQERNLAQQRELYGATLGDTVRSVGARLGLSQAAVARTIGISAPMLSQLASGQRIKIANPQAVERLHSLLALAHEVDDGLPHHEIAPRLARIEQDVAGTLTRGREAATDVPAAFTALLRAVASGRELVAAADLLELEHPALAEVIRVYGTGQPAEAAAHYAKLADLLRT